MHATEKAQADVEKNVKSTIDTMKSRMKSALAKAEDDREKAIAELDDIRIKSLTASMNNTNTESVNEQQNAELKRLQATVAAAEKSFDDLFELYTTQFEDLVDIIEKNTDKMNSLRQKQNECQTELHNIKIRVHDSTMTVDSLRVERDMRVNLDDQYEINRLMIMIEDN